MYFRLLRLCGSVGALLCAPSIARADAPAKPQAPIAKPLQAAPSRAPRDSKPLSAEDAALVRELALVENAELLKNLDLFETRDDAQARDGKSAAPNPTR
jgi:hypothetical protein